MDKRQILHWGLQHLSDKSLMNKTLSIFLTLPLSSTKADYLQGVLDYTGEVLQCADGDRLLRGVLARAVGLGQEGNNHLHMALGAQCA